MSQFTPKHKEQQFPSPYSAGRGSSEQQDGFEKQLCWENTSKWVLLQKYLQDRVWFTTTADSVIFTCSALLSNSVCLPECKWCQLLGCSSSGSRNRPWSLSVLALGSDFPKGLRVRKAHALFDAEAALSSCIIRLFQFPLLEKGHFSFSQAVVSQLLGKRKIKTKWKKAEVFIRSKSGNKSGEEKVSAFPEVPEQGCDSGAHCSTHPVRMLELSIVLSWARISCIQTQPSPLQPPP